MGLPRPAGRSRRRPFCGEQIAQQQRRRQHLRRALHTRQANFRQLIRSSTLQRVYMDVTWQFEKPVWKLCGRARMHAKMPGGVGDS